MSDYPTLTESSISLRYESSATENKSAVEEVLTKEKSNQEERKTSDAPPPCTAVTTFLVTEVKLKQN